MYLYNCDPLGITIRVNEIKFNSDATGGVGGGDGSVGGGNG